MDVRCAQCQQIFAVPTALEGHEMVCPTCGAPNQIPLSSETDSVLGDHAIPHHRPHHHHHRSYEKNVERMYEPIPKILIYIGGFILFLGLSSPFWLTALGTRYRRAEIVFSEESPTAGEAGGSAADAASSGPGANSSVPAEFVDSYDGVRLGDSLKALQERFNLRLVNTMGMEPEIYETKNFTGYESARFSVYSGGLREFTLVRAVARVSPVEIVRELQDRLGEPIDWNAEKPSLRAIGVESTLPDLKAHARGEDVPLTTLADFPYQQQIVWENPSNRLVATIHHSSKDSTECLSLLKLHVSAHAWLDARATHSVGSVTSGVKPGLASDEESTWKGAASNPLVP